MKASLPNNTNNEEYQKLRIEHWIFQLFLFIRSMYIYSFGILFIIICGMLDRKLGKYFISIGVDSIEG